MFWLRLMFWIKWSVTSNLALVKVSAQSLTPEHDVLLTISAVSPWPFFLGMFYHRRKNQFDMWWNISPVIFNMSPRSEMGCERRQVFTLCVLYVRMLIADPRQPSEISPQPRTKEANFAWVFGQRLFLCSRLTHIHPCTCCCCAYSTSMHTHIHTLYAHTKGRSRKPSASITSNYKTG